MSAGGASALFVAGFEEWVATGPQAGDGYRTFVVSAHLRAARDAPPGEWLVEARVALPFPDQSCTVAWDRAPALGIDVTPHYATDAAGERFLPGTGLATVIGAGAPDAEAAALAQAAMLAAPLRHWLAGMLQALNAAAGDATKAAFPAPPEALKRLACRYEPANLAALWQRRRAEDAARDTAAQAARREQDADPIYMPHNVG
jgi:hypothetical protein